MRANASTHDMLWHEVKQKGLQGYAQGMALLCDDPFSNLTEVLGIGVNERLDAMLRMSGVDEAYITGGASDFDKLEALSRVLYLWSGHPLYAAIHRLLDKVFGISDVLTPKSLPNIWQSTARFLFEHRITPKEIWKIFNITRLTVSLSIEEYMQLPEGYQLPDGCVGMLSLGDPVKDFWRSAQVPRLAASTAAKDMSAYIEALVLACIQKGCREISVDLSALERFARPNPYTPAQAVLKLQRGEAVTEEEQALIAAQTVRLLGEICNRHGMTLTFLYTHHEVLEPLCRYLKQSGCLPKTLAVTDRMDVALSCGTAPMLALAWNQTRLSWMNSIQEMASSIPLGRLEGLYFPMNGVMDLPLGEAFAQALCRCVADFGNDGCGSEQRDEQISLLSHILTK